MRIGIWLCLFLCAACTNPGSLQAGETVAVHSYPEGATFTTASGETGKTPALLQKPRGEVLRVRFSMTGYRSEEVLLRSNRAGPLAGYLLLGSGVPLAGSEAAEGVCIEQGRVEVQLQPEESGSSKSSTPTDAEPRAADQLP